MGFKNRNRFQFLSSDFQVPEGMSFHVSVFQCFRVCLGMILNIRVEYGIVEPMEDQDKLRGSGDIWKYIRDIVVQGDWEDRDDDFTFRNDKLLMMGFRGCLDFRMSGHTGLGFNLCVAPALQFILQVKGQQYSATCTGSQAFRSKLQTPQWWQTLYM